MRAQIDVAEPLVIAALFHISAAFTICSCADFCRDTVLRHYLDTIHFRNSTKLPIPQLNKSADLQYEPASTGF